MEREMVAADQAAYAQADKYNDTFYPDLTHARDQMIGQAYGALTGPLNPSLENTFVNTGNMQSVNALGSGDQGFGLAKGSLARNASEASVASNEQGYQDYNRSLFQNLNSIYAPRTFGMNPEDAANIFTFNNTQYNNYLEQKFAADTQAYYQGQAQSAQQGAGVMGAITTVISAAAMAY
jgi:hypothetical protein